MRPSLWFVLPAYERLTLTEVCLRQLSRTCQTLSENGVDASAVVVADDANLDVAQELGFGTVERENRPLGRRWNDGFELAGLTGVDYVVPFGSDDWIDPHFILSGELPAEDTIRCWRLSTIVREDAGAMATLRITYDGGDGIRIIPTAMLHPLNFRPAEEDRHRAIDTSVMRRLSKSLGRPPKIVYHDMHPFQVVDWKSSDQLNSYKDCLAFLDGEESTDPFGELASVYPAESIDAMRMLHGLVAA